MTKINKKAQTNDFITISGLKELEPYLGIYINGDNDKFGLAIYECMLKTPINELEGKKIKIIGDTNKEVLEIFDDKNNSIYKYDKEKLEQYKKNNNEQKRKKEEISGYRDEYINTPEAQEKAQKWLSVLPENLKQDYLLLTYKRPFTNEQYKEIASRYIEYSIAKKFRTKEDLKLFFKNTVELDKCYNNFLLETGEDYIDIDVFKILIEHMFVYIKEHSNNSHMLDKLNKTLEGIDGFIKYHYFGDINLEPPYSREDYNKISYYSSLSRFLKLYKNSERLEFLWRELGIVKKSLNNYMDSDKILSKIKGRIMYELDKYDIEAYLEDFMNSKSIITNNNKPGTIVGEFGLEHELGIDEQTVLYIYLSDLKELYDFLKDNNKLNIL